MSTPFRPGDFFARLLSACDRTPTGWTVEAFGWLILVEGAIILFAPRFVAELLQLGDLGDQGANYFRLAGVLVSGLGMLYVVSGRLNAEGFMFASLLDRPLVPPLMAVLWYLDIVPGTLAVLFAVQDFGSFLWTLLTWRRDGDTAAS